MRQIFKTAFFRKITTLILIVIGMAFFATESQAQTAGPGNILHVKKGATGDGSSWTNALGEVRDALSWAKTNEGSFNANPLQIWVTGGTYTPADDGNREASFVLVNNVAVYGGFKGTENNLTERDWNFNKTILSGDLNQDDLPNFVNYDENSLHVVTGENINETAILDGFIITGGNANQSYPHILGGGIRNDNSSATFSKLKIIKNRANAFGSGVSAENNSDITLINVLIAENSAEGGGGILLSESYVKLINVSIVKNNGYGVFNAGTFGTKPIFMNTIILGNKFGAGTAVMPFFTSTSSNYLFQVAGETSGGNDDAGGTPYPNTTPNDIFEDFNNGNYALKAGSYAIDAGDNTLYDLYGNVNNDTDIVGNKRLAGAHIDLGPYEFGAQVLAIKLTSFEAAPKGDNVLVSWSTLSETNNKGFYVEHSRNGREWTNLAFVATRSAQGNNESLLDYSFIHSSPAAGMHFYRLKQVDMDEQFSYSQVKTVSLSRHSRISLFPNPASSVISINGLKNHRYILKLSNTSGQTIGQYRVQSQDQFTIDVSDLSPGIYYLEIRDDLGGADIRKIIKK